MFVNFRKSFHSAILDEKKRFLFFVLNFEEYLVVHINNNKKHQKMHVKRIIGFYLL